jgi:outer membrane receptor for ferric coprogen and ferric-rhodotorulic acid
MKRKIINGSAGSRLWPATMLGLALAGASAWAQQAAVPGSDEEKAIVLSPFVVSTSTDNGYAATSSMAGTRINTSLKDIAASISVVTKDMMTDLGVNNSGQLLTYTLGTEVSGSSGNFSGAATAPGSLQQDSVNRNFLPAARIRGLANADNTRDFFLTDIPWDSFNTDRVEVNRGPNAMLFGTGSPAGIINQTTAQGTSRKMVE